MAEALAYLVSDQTVFSALQIALVVLTLVALATDLVKRNSGMVVRRGQGSWNSFTLTYGFALLIILEVISLTAAFPNYRTVFAVLDVAAITYLFFFNSWFRNKVVGFLAAAEEKEEHH